MEKILVLDTIVGLVILIRINAPWWAYLLLIGINILLYLVGDNQGWFDK